MSGVYLRCISVAVGCNRYICNDPIKADFIGFNVAAIQFQILNYFALSVTELDCAKKK